jgi:hypothetical protein
VCGRAERGCGQTRLSACANLRPMFHGKGLPVDRDAIRRSALRNQEVGIQVIHPQCFGASLWGQAGDMLLWPPEARSTRRKLSAAALRELRFLRFASARDLHAMPLSPECCTAMQNCCNAL